MSVRLRATYLNLCTVVFDLMNHVIHECTLQNMTRGINSHDPSVQYSKS